MRSKNKRTVIGVVLVFGTRSDSIFGELKNRLILLSIRIGLQERNRRGDLLRIDKMIGNNPIV